MRDYQHAKGKVVIVCLPFHTGDLDLACKNLRWIQTLDGKIDCECLLSFDDQTNPQRMKELAEQVFTKVHTFSYRAPRDRRWPRPQNWAFQNTAWHVFQQIPKTSWLWLESDCVPVRKGWFQAIKERHEKSGKMFTGHWNPQIHVWNGVSVYPHNAAEYSTKMMLDAVNAKGEINPWDVAASKDVRPNLEIANDLFQHIWSDHATGQAWTFPSISIVRKVVRPGVYLFHRCKDFSLGERLMDMKDTENPDATFIHGGDIGDLIYALPTVRELGGGTLIMSPCNTREPMSEAKAAKIAPLLEAQSYIKCTGFEQNPPPAAYNFNCFRDRMKKGKSLALVQSELFGKNGHTTREAWLRVDHAVRAGDYDVILHRSTRYQNKAFPWKQVIKKYGKRALMVGLEQEHSIFCKEFGKVEFHRTGDFLELARVIAGCKLFVGNQSAPYSIAEGLKMPAILEACPTALDCQFERPDLQNDPAGKIKLPEL